MVLKPDLLLLNSQQFMNLGVERFCVEHQCKAETSDIQAANDDGWMYVCWMIPAAATCNLTLQFQHYALPQSMTVWPLHTISAPHTVLQPRVCHRLLCFCIAAKMHEMVSWWVIVWLYWVGQELMGLCLPKVSSMIRGHHRSGLVHPKGSITQYTTWANISFVLHFASQILLN